MTAHDPNEAPAAAFRKKLLWPWFILGAVIIAGVPAGYWMKLEIDRARLLRQHNSGVSVGTTNVNSAAVSESNEPPAAPR